MNLDKLDHRNGVLDHRNGVLDHRNGVVDHRKRLVVIGNGMAATRLVEELVARGATESQLKVTILGDEPTPAYNRILLSAVLEGTHPVSALELKAASWYDAHGIDLRLGARVLELDREHREVMLVDGTRIPYDKVVLATGSIPTLPPIRGLVQLDGQLHPKVHAFRSLKDCDGLMEAVARLSKDREGLDHARPAGEDRPAGKIRAVVVGGGLLGLQVARALSVRGVDTEIVEGADHLLHQQVGYTASKVLERDLKRLGTAVYTGARAIRLDDSGLRLDNGFTLETDLVVLTAGGRPSTALARRAELMVRRGIVVNQALQSVTDADVHAIGDCAEYRSRTTGFVPPAWEQASLLARGLTGDEIAYDGSRNVARLRATGLDVAVLGDPEHAEGDVVEVTNPIIGSHRRLVVKDGVIVAAAMIGDLSRVGLITQLYDKRTVLGQQEPGELLLPEPAETMVETPDDAEVCACAGVSAGRIRACGSVDEVRATTRATTGCGSCLTAVQALLSAREPSVSRA
jgi:NAD(P)H-nitrite reductase large subunit